MAAHFFAPFAWETSTGWQDMSISMPVTVIIPVSTMYLSITALSLITVLLLYMFFLSKTKIENYKELNHRELSEVVEDIDKFRHPDYIRKIIRDNVEFKDLLKINQKMLKYYIENYNNVELMIFLRRLLKS